MRLKTAKAILRDEMLSWNFNELVTEYNRLLGINNKSEWELTNLIVGLLSYEHIITRSKEIIMEEDESEEDEN